MDVIEQLLCVLASLTGSVYCIALLRDCRRRIRSLKEPVKSSPVSSRRGSTCARMNWWSQLLLSAAFLGIALFSLVGFAYWATSALRNEHSIDRQLRQTFATVSIPGYPPLIINYDSTQAGRPIVGIECHSKLISDDQVRDLVHVAPRLRYVSLADTDISDDVLCELSRRPELREISLDRTRVGGPGLRSLSELKSLKAVYLGGTNVADEGLQWLASLQELEALGLDGTQVTDEGLRWLANLRNLRSLNLTNTSVTDAGLLRLGCLDNLTWLELSNTQVTQEGVKRLKSRMPDLSIGHLEWGDDRQ